MVARVRWIVLEVVMLATMFTVPMGRAQSTADAAVEGQATRNTAAYSLPPEKLRQAQALFRARTAIHFGSAAWGIASLVLLLALRLPARMRDLALRLSRSRWVQCFAFVGMLLVMTTALNVPVGMYWHHVTVAYGLSVQGWPSWWADVLKYLLLTWLVAGLLTMMLFGVVRRSPQRWWLWFWFPAMGAVLFGVFLAPVLVDPPFNHFEPLAQSNPELAKRLELVAARSGVDLPLDRMFVMQASKKVTGVNAYVTGMGASKRLVLWDTAIQRATPDELENIFGHELGHYALHHITWGLAGTAVLLLALFWLGFRLERWLLRRFGSGWGIRDQADWAALAVLVLVFHVLSFASEPVNNMVSRAMEHAADVYGQEAIHGIVADPQRTAQQDFQHAGEGYLEDPTPHPWVEWWMFSHPSTARRAAFAAAYNPWRQGEHPKYFAK